MRLYSIVRRVPGFLSGLCMLFGGNVFAGYPSLNPSHHINNVVVDIGTTPTQFTVIQDSSNPRQWYYVPDAPRIAVRDVGGTQIPELTIVKYQTDDPTIEAGMIQAAFSLKIPDEAIEQIREQIMKRKKLADVSLAPMPMKDATVYLLTPEGNSLVAASQMNRDNLAPAFATQRIPVQIEFSRLGTSVFEKLTMRGGTGIPVVVSYTFSGLTPELMCEATVKWEEMYNYLDSNKDLEAQVSVLGGMFGAEGSLKSREIGDKLKQAGLIEMRSITGGNLTNEECERLVFQPLLSRMQKALFESATIDPKAISDAVMTESERDTGDKNIVGKAVGAIKGLFGSGSASADIRKVSIQRARSYSEFVTFRTRSLVDQTTTVGGFIGIGDFPDAVRENAVVLASDREWDRALVMLPLVALEIEVTGIDLSLKPDIDATIADKDFRWHPVTGWTDYRGVSASYAYFPLLDLGLSKELRQGVPMRANFTIVKRGQALSATRIIKADEENNLAQNILESVEPVTILDENLTWGRLNGGAGVNRVSIKLESGGKRKQINLMPRNVDGVWLPPDPQYWLIEAGNPVTAEIFIHSNGESVPWEHNGANLWDTPDGLTVGLSDEDWQ